jgi:hypothetical protein
MDGDLSSVGADTWPLLRTLAELLAFVADQTGEGAGRLSRILRAQLPPHEQVLIFMHGLSPWGRIFLKGYVEEMHIFKYYSSDPMIPGQQIRHWYDAPAFT